MNELSHVQRCNIVEYSSKTSCPSHMLKWIYCLKYTAMLDYSEHNQRWKKITVWHLIPMPGTIQVTVFTSMHLGTWDPNLSEPSPCFWSHRNLRTCWKILFYMSTIEERRWLKPCDFWFSIGRWLESCVFWFSIGLHNGWPRCFNVISPLSAFVKKNDIVASSKLTGSVVVGLQVAVPASRCSSPRENSLCHPK